MRIVSIFVLLVKDGLHRSVFRFLKVAQTNANQPITLLPTEINPFSQLQGDVRQLFAGGGWGAWRMAASENLELACFQLQNNRACRPWFFPRSRPKLFCEAPDHRLSFRQQHVVLKSVLGGYRLCRPVRDNLVVVDSEGKLVQALTIAAEMVFEYGQFDGS